MSIFIFMKNTRLGTHLAIIALSSACFIACADDTSTTTGSYRSCSRVSSLNDYQKNFGKYKLNEKIPFRHSDGQDIFLTVTKALNDADSMSCQVFRDVWLESDYPILSIKLNASSVDSSSTSIRTIKATIGKHEFYLDDPSTSNNLDTLIESLKVNKNTYHDVAVVKDLSSLNSGAMVYYNQKSGIIRIDLEDESSITLNEREGY